MSVIDEEKQMAKELLTAIDQLIVASRADKVAISKHNQIYAVSLGETADEKTGRVFQVQISLVPDTVKNEQWIDANTAAIIEL